MTHICVGNLTVIVSDYGLSPGRRQAIIWTNYGILLIEPLGTNISEILIEILTFSFKKMRLKVSSAKWRPCCLGLNVLTYSIDCNVASTENRRGWIVRFTANGPLLRLAVQALTKFDRNFTSAIKRVTCRSGKIWTTGFTMRSSIKTVCGTGERGVVYFLKAFIVSIILLSRRYEVDIVKKHRLTIRLVPWVLNRIRNCNCIAATRIGNGKCDVTSGTAGALIKLLSCGLTTDS